MASDFTSFFTVFQSYQNDGCVILKSCLQWIPVGNYKGPGFLWASNPGQLDQQASA